MPSVPSTTRTVPIYFSFMLLRYHSSWLFGVITWLFGVITVRRIRVVLYETFKNMSYNNSECLNDMSVKKETSYTLRKKVILIQPKRRTTTYGLRPVSYLGSKPWNDHSFNMTDVSNFDDQSFRSTLHLIDEKFVSKIMFISFNWIKALCFMCRIPVHVLLHCLYFCNHSFTSPWIMLSVLTTLRTAFCVASCRVVSCRAMPCRAVLCYVVSYRIVSYRIVSIVSYRKFKSNQCEFTLR